MGRNDQARDPCVLRCAVLLELTVMSFGGAVETTDLTSYPEYLLTCSGSGWICCCCREGYQTSGRTRQPTAYAQLILLLLFLTFLATAIVVVLAFQLQLVWYAAGDRWPISPLTILTTSVSVATKTFNLSGKILQTWLDANSEIEPSLAELWD